MFKSCANNKLIWITSDCPRQANSLLKNRISYTSMWRCHSLSHSGQNKANHESHRSSYFGTSSHVVHSMMSISNTVTAQRLRRKWAPEIPVPSLIIGIQRRDEELHFREMPVRWRWSWFSHSLTPSLIDECKFFIYSQGLNSTKFCAGNHPNSSTWVTKYTLADFSMPTVAVMSVEKDCERNHDTCSPPTINSACRKG